MKWLAGDSRPRCTEQEQQQEEVEGRGSVSAIVKQQHAYM
jgi:hypothetical protein